MRENKMWAVMDIGTNSCRLLLAETDSGSPGKIRKRQAYLRTTRIGEGCGEENRLISEEGLNRTLAALREYAAIIRENPVGEVILAATQAVRAARNRDILVEAVKAEFGWKLEILSGEEEARLSFLGATAGFAQERQALVVDIGGGSTELAWKEEERAFRAVSIPLGALRLLEAPRGDMQVMEIIEEALTALPNPEGLLLAAKSLLIGVGGTCTTAAAISLSLENYDSERVQGHRLGAAEIRGRYELLKGLETSRRLQVAGIPPGREDIIVPGLQLLLAVLRVLAQEEITVSDRDLLYGLITVRQARLFS